MRGSRGMGAMLPAKLKGVTKVGPQMNPDNTNVYKRGGKVKNEAVSSKRTKSVNKAAKNCCKGA